MSMDNNKANWERAIERAGLVWHHVSSLKGMNRCPVAKLYQVVAIRSCISLVKTGRLSQKICGGKNCGKK